MKCFRTEWLSLNPIVRSQFSPFTNFEYFRTNAHKIDLVFYKSLLIDLIVCRLKLLAFTIIIMNYLKALTKVWKFKHVGRVL